MLDCFLDYIYPAVTRGYVREYGDSTMFFYDTKVIQIRSDEENPLFLYGKFVKDTFIRREQVYVDGKLLQDKDVFQNSPSSIFIISLSDHRMFYIKEHRDSPNIDSFKSTMESIVNKHIKRIIDDEYSRLMELNSEYPDRVKKPVKSKIEKNYPYMELDIIQLSSDANLEQFINEFKSIDRLSLALVMPNDETDPNDFFRSWRITKNKLNGAKSKIDFTKKGQSLPHSEVIDIAKDALNDGNIIINITGKDDKNDKINGTHESFKLTANIGELESTPEGVTSKIFRIFKDLINNGTIKHPRLKDKETIELKIAQIKDATIKKNHENE